MFRSRMFALLTLLAALPLAGCNLSSSTSPTSAPIPVTTSAPTAGGEPTTAATSAPETTTTAEPTTIGPVGGPIITNTLQMERITITAAGELEPATITATVGLTIEFTLANRGETDALLLFDLAPGGALAVPLPSAAITGTGTLTPTAPVATAPAEPTAPTASVTAEPTAPLILLPTGLATSVVTGTTTATNVATSTTTGTAIAPTSTVTETATPGPTEPAGASERVVWLRFDQPGTYTVRCVPQQDEAQPACSGTVEITVQAPAAAPTETPTATAEPTETTPLTSTATLTSTSTLTSTVTLTGTTEATTTATTSETATSSTAPASPEATTTVTTTTTP